jgi:hypothetical protein
MMPQPATRSLPPRSGRQKTPQQTVVGEALSLSLDGRRGHECLIGYNAMPVYIYSRDKGAQPTCYDECAIRSPPYIVGAQDNLGPKSGWRVEKKLSLEQGDKK